MGQIISERLLKGVSGLNAYCVSCHHIGIDNRSVLCILSQLDSLL